jgi:SAM-dependent methyltransferase
MRDPCPQRLEFDAKAEVYESNRLAPWYQAQGDRVLEHLSIEPADVVLDVGCGTGYLLRQIARAWPGVIGIGVDIAPKRLSLFPDAREPFPTPVSALRAIHDLLRPERPAADPEPGQSSFLTAFW